MVVKNILLSQADLLGKETISDNCAVLRGAGPLGITYFRALSLSCPYGGVHYIETLVDTATGRIVEILLPDPKRIYEREILDASGVRKTVPVKLSVSNPSARLAVLLVSAQMPHDVVDVIARDEIAPEARACLHECIRESRRERQAIQKVA